MKIRTSFVSNSSSSSFVVIDASQGYETLDFKEGTFIIGEEGETKFGWGPKTLTDIWSRINFAYLQIQEANNPPWEWEYMLYEVLRDETGARKVETIVHKHSFIQTTDVKTGYIDHQSSAVEEQNIEIFESKEKLKDFIFGVDSKIVLDNDNH